MSGLVAGSQVMELFVAGGGGLLAGRLGATEYALVTNPVGIRNLARGKLNAGLWPPTPAQARRFKLRYLAAVEATDVVAIWGDTNLPGESTFLGRLTPAAVHVPLMTLDSVALASRGVQPWTGRLAGMRVCVVSSMASEISSQYARRRRLFASDLDILPVFDLWTIETPKTHGLSTSRNTWSEHSNRLAARVTREAANADLVLISAGAYGMPLAYDLAREGIRSVYVGGCLQLLFGLWGKRWKADPALQGLATKDWIDAPASSAPLGSQLIEGGAYW